jgi:hypothetical protein
MLDKLTLMSLGIKPDTDPNNPSTWSDELKINHKRVLDSLGDAAKKVLVKPEGDVTGQSASFVPASKTFKMYGDQPTPGTFSAKDLEDTASTADDKESDENSADYADIDTSDLKDLDKAPKGVGSSEWGKLSSESKEAIHNYIKAHRDYIAKYTRNGKLPSEDYLSEQATGWRSPQVVQDWNKLGDYVKDASRALGKEAFDNGERTTHKQVDFNPKEADEYDIENHQESLGANKAFKLLQSSYPLGFGKQIPSDEDSDDYITQEAFRSSTRKASKKELDDLASNESLTPMDEDEDESTHSTSSSSSSDSGKKPGMDQDELDSMEDLDFYECDTCGAPAIGYDDEDGYQCRDCYKDTHTIPGSNNAPKEESSTPATTSESEGTPRLSPIKDDDVPQYTPGPYETDIDKIKSQFAITSSSTARKDGTPDFIANYTNPEVPGHTKLAVSAMVSPNATGRPNPNGGRLYSINWGGDSVTLANGKNSTKLVGWGTGQFGKGIATGNREDEFNLAVHSVAKKIAEYHSKVNGKLAGYTAPQSAEENSTPKRDVDAQFEQNTAIKVLTEVRNRNGKKSSGYAAVDAALSRVAEGGAGTQEDERARIKQILEDEHSKHKNGSIMQGELNVAKRRLGYDDTPTVQEQNQAETESGSNVSAQMTEAGIPSSQSEEEPANGQSISTYEQARQFVNANPPTTRGSRTAVTIGGYTPSPGIFGGGGSVFGREVTHRDFPDESKGERQVTYPISEDQKNVQIELPGSVVFRNFSNPNTPGPGNTGVEAPAKRAKLPAVGSVPSEALPKEQRFAANLRPTNVSEEHWKALGELGDQGKAARGFISMYAQKWHDIKDKGTKDSGKGFYTLDQLKSDKDAVERFFSESPDNRAVYNGAYFKKYREISDNTRLKDLKPSSYNESQIKKGQKATSSLNLINGAFGEVPNNARSDDFEAHTKLGKGIVDRILSAYPMPE